MTSNDHAFIPDALIPIGADPGGTIEAFLGDREVQSRPYQRRIISQVLEILGGSDRPGIPQEITSVLIESPTGSGKTVMGLALAAIIQQATGARVGWVAMRRNLLHQAAAENAARQFGVKAEWISMFDRNPPKVDLLIVDEAQHDAATSMSTLHGKVRPDWTIGLSATPFRSDRVKLCFETVIRDAGIAALIADGYLSSFHHYTIDEYSPESVAELLIDTPQKWGKSLVFFHRQTQCDELHARLARHRIRSEIVTAKTDRDRQLADFASGRLDVLINMAILTEGFDCPSLQTVFCRPSSKGCTIQMAGRVLRKCDEVPCKQIVQCKRTPHPMMRTAMPSEQYLWTDNGWRSIRANTRLDAMTMTARRQISKSNVKLPKLVQMHRSRKNRFWDREDSAA